MRGTAWWVLLVAATPAVADTIDRPSEHHPALHGNAHVSGEITLDAGFPSHTYTAARAGFVRVTLDVRNTRRSDNRGRAWRPYLRVISVPSDTRRGEGWSTNGDVGTEASSHASLVIRVEAGEQLTVIATVAENVAKGRPAAEASYVLATAELADGSR